MRRRYLLVFGVLLLLLIGGYWYARPLLHIAVGYATKHACSCHFLQERDLEEIAEHDLNFSVLPYVSLRVGDDLSIEGSLLGGLIRRTATYRPGYGCRLQYLADEMTELPTLTAPAEGVSTREDSLFLVRDPVALAVDSTALRQALDFGMAPVAGGGARGIVVLQHGRLLGEVYAPGYSPETPLLGWSMTKSINNALVGILVRQGRLSLEETPLFAEWADDERREITLADLLHMSSRLTWNEAYGSKSDATIMLYQQADMGAYAKNKPRAQDLEYDWQYSSGTSNIISLLIRRQFADDAAYQAFVRDSLFRAIGMQTALIESDASGTQVGSSYGWASARDWARFGQLYLQDGRWNGRRMLPAGWVDWSRTPTSSPHDVYGAHLWLKGPDMPNAPDDIFMFRGFQDQRVFVIPSRQCVIVRLGHNDDQVADFDTFVQKVLAALPQG